MIVISESDIKAKQDVTDSPYNPVSGETGDEVFD